MPDKRYIKFPRKESLLYFETAMNGHNRVTSCEKISEGYYKIIRDALPPILVFVSDFYALSTSDYYDVTRDYNIDCLITISEWNTVTPDAYRLGKMNGVGVFTMREFMGAMNCENPSAYVRPIDRKNN